MSNYNFATVPKAEIQRSSFDRSHTWKGTFDEGKLIPFFVDEVLPGDTFNLNVSMLCRLATPIVPIMDNVYLDTFFFFVPNRLVWNNFQKFMGEQEDPDDSIDYVEPLAFQVATSGSYSVEVESLADYMGAPLGTNVYGKNKANFSALPFRAYYLIWNEWFRDENLQDSIKINKSDSDAVYTSWDLDFAPAFNKTGSLCPRAKRHDYFTSALPWPAKPLGDSASITVPLGGTANIIADPNGDGIGVFRNSYTDEVVRFPAGGSTYTSNLNLGNWTEDPTISESQGGRAVFISPLVEQGSVGLNYDPNGSLKADLTTATGVTINQLRQSFQIQRFLERCARGGTRYTEILRSMFGTISPDARLQRPEYLGGTSQRMQVNVVPQTSASEDDVSPQANLAAFATGTNGRNDGFVKSFTEHGYVFGLLSIRGPLIYQQGLNRMFSKRTRFDYYWPVFAHLGEQEILNKEIYLQGTSDDDGVFGYQERYAEYRYFPSLVTGKFRSTYAQSLDSWHLAQKFDSLPTLSGQFIKEDPPISRVVSVPSEPHFLVDIDIKMDCARPMPLYGVPGLIDHF